MRNAENYTPVVGDTEAQAVYVHDCKSLDYLRALFLIEDDPRDVRDQHQE